MGGLKSKVFNWVVTGVVGEREGGYEGTIPDLLRGNQVNV